MSNFQGQKDPSNPNRSLLHHSKKNTQEFEELKIYHSKTMKIYSNIFYNNIQNSIDKNS